MRFASSSPSSCPSPPTLTTTPLPTPPAHAHYMCAGPCCDLWLSKYLLPLCPNYLLAHKSFCRVRLSSSPIWLISSIAVAIGASDCLPPHPPFSTASLLTASWYAKALTGWHNSQLVNRAHAHTRRGGPVDALKLIIWVEANVTS